MGRVSGRSAVNRIFTGTGVETRPRDCQRQAQHDFGEAKLTHLADLVFTVTKVRRETQKLKGDANDFKD